MEKKTRTSLNLVSKIFNLFDYLCTSTFHVIKFLMSTFADKSGIDVSLCLTFYYTKIKIFSIISFNTNLVSFEFRQCFLISINIKWKRKQELL